MNTFNAYFKRHFLTSWVKVVVFSILGAIIIIQRIGIIYNQYSSKITNSPEFYINYHVTKPIIEYLIAFAVIIALITPVLEFYTFNNKNNLDTLFSMPISKSKLLLAHYLNGAVQITIAFTVMYLIWLLTYVYASYTELHMESAYLAYPIILLCALGIYTIFSFIFTRANSTVDGCIFIFLHFFLFNIIISFIEHITIIDHNHIHVFDKYIPINPEHKPFLDNCTASVKRCSFTLVLDQLSSWLNNSLTPGYTVTRIKDALTGERQTIYEYYTHQNGLSPLDTPAANAMCFFIVLAIISLVLILISFKRKTAVNVGDISESWLGYKMLGPIYSICCMTMVHRDVAMSIIGLVVMFLGYMLYRRGVKFKLPDIIVMALTVLFAIFSVKIY